MEFGSTVSVLYIQSHPSLNIKESNTTELATYTTDGRTVQPLKKRNPNQDGGYAWVVMAAVLVGFICYAPSCGTFTLTYQQLLIKYEMSATTAGLVNALHGSVRMFSSPLVSVLHYHTSYRTVTILGGVLYATGVIMMAFANTPWVIYVGYGVISGLGTNMYVLTSFVIISLYFVEKRGKAIGLSFCGTSIGTMIFSPVVAYMYSSYGYTSTVVFMACFALQICIIGALFRPLVVTTQDSVNGMGTDTQQQEMDPEKNMQQDQLKMTAFNQIKKHFLSFLSQSGFSLLTNIKYLAFCCVLGSTIGTLLAGFTYMSALAKEVCGLSDTQIALVMSIGSFFEIPSRIATGIVIDLKVIRPYRTVLFISSALVTSVLYFCLPFASTFVSFASLWSAYQMMIFSTHCQHIVLMGEILPPEQLPRGISMSRILQGVGLFLFPTIMGTIKDNMGLFSYGFFVISMMFTFFILLFALIKRCC